MSKINKKLQNTPIPEARISYFDKTAFELLELMSVQKLDKLLQIDSDKTIGSIKEQNVIEISNVGRFVEQNGIEIYAYEDSEKIGFNEANGPTFYKFINNIYKTSQVNMVCGKEFIQNLTFDWLVNTKKNGKADANFSAYMHSTIDNSIEELRVFHFIPHLLLDKPFMLGNCELGFFTKGYFNALSGGKKTYDDLSIEYSGKVFISTIVKSEIEKAKEIALHRCSLAIDVLKTCSVTLLNPAFDSSFEIDLRLNRNIDNEIFVEHLNKEQRISRVKFGSGRPFIMDDHQMNGFKERSIDLFSNFLLEVEEDNTELENIIISAIQQFSVALSTLDLHQRIAMLFSILESTLLLNETGNLSETVCKYLCRLIYKSRDDRETLIALYKKMYKVRSAWVHHAKKVEFEERDLSFLQLYVHRLLMVLIRATNNHKTKETILEEIDNAILSS